MIFIFELSFKPLPFIFWIKLERSYDLQNEIMYLIVFILQIWVQSPHNASGYYTIYGDDSSYQDHFNARLVTGNTGEVYARTGYLGFLRRTEAIGSDGGNGTNVFSSEIF